MIVILTVKVCKNPTLKTCLLVNGQFPQGQFTRSLGFVGSVPLSPSIGHHFILPFEHVESGLGMSEK